MFEQVTVDIFYFYPDDGRMGCNEAYCLGYDGDHCYFTALGIEDLSTFRQKVFHEHTVFDAVESDFSNFLMSKITESFMRVGLSYLVDMEPGTNVYAGMGNIGTYIGRAPMNVQQMSADHGMCR